MVPDPLGQFMSMTSGLKLTIEERERISRTASAIYDPMNEILGVRIVPPATARAATFVRTASIHFDIDSNGDVFFLEIMGPAREKLKVSNLSWPGSAIPARVRFSNPEECAEEDIESFETDPSGKVLRIRMNVNSIVRWVEPAAGLVFGADSADRLVELWIAEVAVRDGGGFL